MFNFLYYSLCFVPPINISTTILHYVSTSEIEKSGTKRTEKRENAIALIVRQHDSYASARH